MSEHDGGSGFTVSEHADYRESGAEDLDFYSNSDNDTASMGSELSETSTVEFEQESYGTFKRKVYKLIVELFPDRAVEDIEVERMKGGSFNRIIGVKICESRNKFSRFSLHYLRDLFRICGNRRRSKNFEMPQDYVLRIPRDITGDISYQTATLSFVGFHFGCQVPKVCAHDQGCVNALQTGYMLQQYIPGQQLDAMWSSLNAAQRKSATYQHVRILQRLHRITSPSAGIISPQNLTSDMTGTVKLEQLPLGYSSKDGSLSRPQTTLEWILDMCKRWNKNEETMEGECWHGMWDKFASMALRLHELGLIPDSDRFHFAHLDLERRNLVAVVENESTVKITGILDWDTAAFVPKFVSYQPPYYLWQEDEDTDEADENLALTIPNHAEYREYKMMYEEACSAEALRYAYESEFILARRMFRLLRTGIYSNYCLASAKDIVRKFEELHPYSTNQI